MNIGSLYISKKKLAGYVFLIIMMVSIPFGVILVQKTQVLQSHASLSPVLGAFEVRDANEKLLTCTDPTETAPATCNTSTQEVTIKVKDLNALITQ